MNFNLVQKIAPVLNLCVGLGWLAFFYYKGAIKDFDAFFLFLLVLVNLTWIILSVYYFWQQRFAETIQKIVRDRKTSVTQDHTIDTISNELPDPLNIKAVNGFFFLKSLAVISGILQFLTGLLIFYIFLFNRKTLDISFFMKHVHITTLVFLLTLMTLINGILVLYQIITINRAAKKIEQARAELDEV